MYSNIKNERYISIALLMWAIVTFFYAFEMMLKSSTGALYNVFVTTFGASPFELSLMDSSFFIVYVILQLPAGILVDRYGVKICLIVASLAIVVGTLLFSYGDSLFVLICARGIMGIAGAFGFICAITLASQWFSNRIFPFVAGSTNFLGYIGASFSGLPLAFTLNHLDWRVAFLVFCIISVVLFFLFMIFIKDTKDNFSQKGKRLHVVQHIKEVLKMCIDKTVLLNGIFSGVTQGVTFALANLWGQTFLIDVVHRSKNEASFVGNSIIFIGVAFTAPLWGALAVKIKNQYLLVLGACIGFIASVLFIYFPKIDLLFIASLGFLIGMAQSSHILNYDSVKQKVSRSQLSSSFAFINLCGIFGGVVVQLLIGFTINSISDGSNLTSFDYKIGLLIIYRLFFL